MRPADNGELDDVLAEQLAYYRALGADYLDQSLGLPGMDELRAALEAFRPSGRVLELACGPGIWTQQLARHATHVTAVDASPEMLAAAKDRVDSDRVRFVQADLFTWEPDGQRYDVVFLGFWLSHVPLERFAAFWSMVSDCLTENGRVFIADDAYRTPEELIEGVESSTIRRRLDDGSSYRLMKVAHRSADLERLLQDLGWDVTITSTAGPFYWGAGRRGQTAMRQAGCSSSHS